MGAILNLKIFTAWIELWRFICFNESKDL